MPKLLRGLSAENVHTQPACSLPPCTINLRYLPPSPHSLEVTALLQRPSKQTVHANLSDLTTQ